MKYIVKPTSQPGQSILESVERRDGAACIAAISVQLPTEAANEIAHCVNEFPALFAEMGELEQQIREYVERHRGPLY
jgi:hypothetical protein